MTDEVLFYSKGGDDYTLSLGPRPRCAVVEWDDESYD